MLWVSLCSFGSPQTLRWQDPHWLLLSLYQLVSPKRKTIFRDNLFTMGVTKMFGCARNLISAAAQFILVEKSRAHTRQKKKQILSFAYVFPIVFMWHVTSDTVGRTSLIIPLTWYISYPQVHHDMTAPMQHYFIYTGHNSYLTGNQLSSDCSDIPIIRALQRGVRAIELDVWPNSSKDDINVLHGRCVLVSYLSWIQCLLQNINSGVIYSSQKWTGVSMQVPLKPGEY